jgi:hypothetical protein
MIQVFQEGGSAKGSRVIFDALTLRQAQGERVPLFRQQLFARRELVQGRPPATTILPVQPTISRSR